MDGVECIVVGAGVVGLAIARRLAGANLEVLLIEQENAIGIHTSSRNNEVIHAGFLYPPGSLKGKLCRRGRDQLYAYCETHSVEHSKTGKYVIAAEEADLPILRQYQDFGLANGVDDLRFIDGDTAQAEEPNLQCIAAIHSPSTGIIDCHALMQQLLADGEAQGALVALGTRVARYRTEKERIVVDTVSTDGDAFSMSCRLLVIAAGLGANGIEETEPAKPVPEIAYAKGNFFALTGPKPFHSLIVPVGRTLQEGGAFTLDLGGQSKFGPDLEWVHGIDYSVDESRRQGFADAIRRYYPGIDPNTLTPSYSGIRPRVAPVTPDTDWDIRVQHNSGTSTVTLFGIDTPGLTSCMAIADHVAELLGV